MLVSVTDLALVLASYGDGLRKSVKKCWWFMGGLRDRPGSRSHALGD